MPPPERLNAKAYERHIDLELESAAKRSTPSAYIIYRSLDSDNLPTDRHASPRRKSFHRLPRQDRRNRALQNRNIRLRLSRITAVESQSPQRTHAMTDDELLTMLQEECFRYYWEGAHPDSGMTRENIPGDDRIVATGASGFGIMALIVGHRSRLHHPRARTRSPHENRRRSSKKRRAITARGLTSWTATPAKASRCSTFSTTPATSSRPRS